MYAIVYNGETKEIQVPQGNKVLRSGMLLGYTDYPDDPIWNGKPVFFVEIETYDKPPFEWEYKNGEWKEVKDGN